MPRVLNVAKLEKKFQTLSRSRESIQGLAAWIIGHKDVYQDIVEQWLIGVSKKINTLLMFYVANEVIQGCGKKKCPEFRKAFSEVLEKAASFENVQEIKKDVIRLLTLWNERNIYDDEFKQRIENILNSSVETEESSEEEEEEEDLPEIEIIKQFKKENIIERLEKLKSLEKQIKEKEDILNYADVPEIPDLEDIIIRRNCQDMVRKCDKYLAVVKECSELARKETSLRKKILKELKNTCVFYTAQQKDVKEVYNAFRIYGKRISLVETRLSEKISTLPSFDSPCFSEENTNTSTSNRISPSIGSYETDTSPASKSSFSMSPSPLNEPSQSSKKSKLSFSLLGKVLQESVSESFEIVKQPPHRKSAEKFTVAESTNSNTEKAFELEDVQAHQQSVLDKQSSLSKDSTCQELKETNTPFIEKNRKMSDVSTKETEGMEEEKNFIEKEAVNIPERKASFSKSDIRRQSVKAKGSPAENQTLSSDERAEMIVEKGSTQSGITEQKEQLSSIPRQGAEDVDFLLEESYGSKKTKTSLSYKRKIAFLLKSKEKKSCTETSSEEPPEEDSLVLNTVDNNSEKKDYMDVDDLNSREMEIDKVETAEKPESIDSTSVADTFKNVNIPENYIGTIRNLVASSPGDTDNTENSSNAHNVSDADLSFKNEIKSEDAFSFNLGGTFTGSALSSFMTGMSTDFLKNILHSNQQNSQTEIQEDNKQIPLPEVDTSSVNDSPNTSTDLNNESSNKCDKDLPINSNNSQVSDSKSLLTTETIILQPDSTLSGPVTSQMSNSDDLKLSKEEILPANIKQDKLDTAIDTYQLLNSKATLLETLQNVLECLSENMSSGRDFNNYLSEKYPELDPPLSFESCLKLYEYIHGTFKNENNTISTENNFKTSVIPVAPTANNNYEVMDMECDSEEEG